MKITLKVPNISCPTCALTIEEHFKTLNINARVLTNQKKVIFNVPEDVSLGFLTKELTGIGFPPIVTDEKELKQRKYEQVRLIIATILVLPLMYIMLGKFGLDIVPPLMLNGYFQLVFASLLQFYVGYRFYRNAFYQIKTKNLGMDVLIVLGTTVAYIYSIYLTIFSDTVHFFFMTSGMIIYIVALGEYLENSSKARTTDTLKELMSFKVNEVKLLKDEKEIITPLNEIKVGDKIKILAGEKVPLDGVIIEGNSYIDDSVITGESLPKYLGTNDKVIGATTNLTNTLVIEVSAVGSDTVLAQIIETVEETSLIKPKFQRIVDKVAKYFVFAIIIIALLTFIIYQFILKEPLSTSLVVAIAILVVSCPCALGLATPTSIAVSSGIAFKNKILYKGGEFFELADKIDAIGFDKTGTLTKGELSVINYVGDEKCLVFTKSLEAHSNHPLAKAINKYRTDLALLEVNDFAVIEGKGLKGIVGKKEILTGSFAYFAELGIDNPYTEDYERYTKRGSVVIFTALNNEIVNMIVLEDEIKAESKALISALKKNNITPYLITGDNENTARYIAALVGIEEVYANVLPHEKAHITSTLQEKHKVVAFVGDGINDAPALKQADVSFSVANASDIASDTADVVLLENDLKTVLMAIDLSKKTTRNIKENLVWAFTYNAVMIPLAIFNIASPLLGGILHVASSLLVVLNALRLGFYKYKGE